MKKLLIILFCVLILCFTSCTSADIGNNATGNGGTTSASSSVESFAADRFEIKQEEVEMIEENFEKAQQDSGVDLEREELYYPPILAENGLTEVEVIESYGDGEDASKAIGFIKYSTESTKINDYYVYSVTMVETAGGIHNGVAIQESLVLPDGTKYTDNGNDFYLTTFPNTDDLTITYFFLRYRFGENTLVDVKLHMENSDPIEMSDELAKQIYRDFQIVPLDDLKKAAE